MYIAMNNFRVNPEKADEFEAAWRERESFLDQVPGFREFHLLKGPREDNVQWFASHTVWADEAAFVAWTESEVFRKAHAQGRSSAGTLLGPPEFRGWRVIL